MFQLARRKLFIKHQFCSGSSEFPNFFALNDLLFRSFRHLDRFPDVKKMIRDIKAAVLASEYSPVDNP